MHTIQIFFSLLGPLKEETSIDTEFTDVIGNQIVSLVFLHRHRASHGCSFNIYVLCKVRIWTIPESLCAK